MMNFTTEQLALFSNMPTDPDELKKAQADHRQKIAESREKEKQRKARTHRLIKHGAIFESIFPQTAEMDETAFAGFVASLAQQTEKQYGGG